MKCTNVLLLFYTSLLVECATAAVRSGILYHHNQRRGFQSNTSIEVVQYGLSTAGSTVPAATLSELADPTAKYDIETAFMPTTDTKADGSGRITSYSATESVKL
ncbi:hypothetical protein Trisim1_005003 [Trichoderma cf. simile WF8]